MYKKLITIFFISIVLMSGLKAQENNAVSIKFIEKDSRLLPGQITNLAFFITNQTANNQIIKNILSVPEKWKIISNSQEINLSPSEKKLFIFTIQVPSSYPVGNYNIQLFAIRTETNDTVNSFLTVLTVKEIENISMAFVDASENVVAGQTIKASYLLQNLGNTKKKGNRSQSINNGYIIFPIIKTV